MVLCWSKKRHIWLWWAIDRATKRVIGWTLGSRTARTGRKLVAQIPPSPVHTYATDQLRCYRALFPKEQLVQSKAHTYTIESLNFRLRHYMARFKRRSCCYSKSERNMQASIMFFLMRKCNVRVVSI